MGSQNDQQPTSRIRLIWRQIAAAARWLWRGVCVLCRWTRALVSIFKEIHAVWLTISFVLAYLGLNWGEDALRWGQEQAQQLKAGHDRPATPPKATPVLPQLAPIVPVTCIFEPLSTFADIITRDPAKFGIYKGRPLCDGWKPLFIQRLPVPSDGGWHIVAGRNSLPSLEIEFDLRSAEAGSLRVGDRVRVEGTPSQYEAGKLKLTDVRLYKIP